MNSSNLAIPSPVQSPRRKRKSTLWSTCFMPYSRYISVRMAYSIDS